MFLAVNKIGRRIQLLHDIAFVSVSSETMMKMQQNVEVVAFSSFTEVSKYAAFPNVAMTVKNLPLDTMLHVFSSGLLNVKSLSYSFRECRPICCDLTLFRNLQCICLTAVDFTGPLTPLQRSRVVVLHECRGITDVSPLKNAYKVDLSGSDVVDAAPLKNVHSLVLDFCAGVCPFMSSNNSLSMRGTNINDVSMFRYAHNLSLRGCSGLINLHYLNNVYQLNLMRATVSPLLVGVFLENNIRILTFDSSHLQLVSLFKKKLQKRVKWWSGGDRRSATADELLKLDGFGSVEVMWNPALAEVSNLSSLSYLTITDCVLNTNIVIKNLKNLICLTLASTHPTITMMMFPSIELQSLPLLEELKIWNYTLTSLVVDSFPQRVFCYNGKFGDIQVLSKITLLYLENTSYSEITFGVGIDYTGIIIREC
jgi:hypothetical protein